MKRGPIILGALAITLVVAIYLRQDSPPEITQPKSTEPIPAPPTEPASEAEQGFLYGRVLTVDGRSYEGRLRWGGSEEAFWGDYFNGTKVENPWAALVPPSRLKESSPLEIFGVRIVERELPIDLERPFAARFGDIEQIAAEYKVVRVTLKSGSTFELDRRSADDLADGVRVWDGRRGVADLEEGAIQLIELLPTRRLDAAPHRLHGTVSTGQGDFSGFIQWDRRKAVGTDELHGRSANREIGLRFDTIRSIARNSADGSVVTLRDGQAITLSGPEVSGDNRGIFVDDQRYGRVLISWAAFEAVDFSKGESVLDSSGPAFGEFPPGYPLQGRITTRAGDHHAGRLVFDLDESETTEMLDAPSGGVNYSVPFGLIASIAPHHSPTTSGNNGVATQRASVLLHSGEELRLDQSGDLGEGNGGILIFVDDREQPQYVPWDDVERIDLDRPPVMYPPLDGP